MAEIEPDSSGEGLRVGIVRSRFNERIGVAMLEACRKRLGELRVTALTVVSVPGALEAPLALQKLANTEKYDALIAPPGRFACFTRAVTPDSSWVNDSSWQP